MYQRLVPLLREAREAAGLSQVQIAQHFGKPQSWVAKIESGERRIDPAELISFAEALGLDPMKFFATIVARLSAPARR
jgi:transcriptional regulator with XRE-family HTH domain